MIGDAGDTGSELGELRVMIAGGGTAGHVLPGISIANALVGRGVAREHIHFVGAERGIEARIVPEANFDISLLPGRGIQRRFTIENIRSVWGLVKACFLAFNLVRTKRPAVVLGLGGFASAACAISAVVQRVPLVLAEQNARAGAVNRLVGRFARAAAVPFPDVDLPRTVLTGNPVRDEIIEASQTDGRAEARAQLGLPQDRTVLLVFAGSLGSRRINDALYGALEKWRDRADLAIHHVVGARDWDDRPDLDTGLLFYNPIRYEDRMDLALSAADMAVCRSGGTTVAELAVMGLPAVMVPLPIATRDHQYYNAMQLVSVGGAVCVRDEEFGPDELIAGVAEVMSNLDERASALRGAAKADAAERVADLIISQVER